MTEVIAADRLCKRYRAVEALRDISFTITGPQVIGVLGPNGAGKTTLLDILEGIAEPTGGEVRLFGTPLHKTRYPRRRVGVVLQREFAFDKITTGEYAQLFAAIYRVPSGRRAILEAADLLDRESVAVERLSGGEAQRLFIAAASVHRPDLLFLDEPTAHLDPQSKSRIGALVKQLGRTSTVVITTHDLREADAVCDHVLFLVGGQLKAEGPRAALVDSVPPDERRGLGLEDAFFHFCTARLTAAGDLDRQSAAGDLEAPPSTDAEPRA